MSNRGNTAIMLIQSQVDFIALLRNTGPVAGVVLATLLIVSIWSWGIILSKLLLLRKVTRESETFWKIFRRGKTLSEIAAACETLRFTPLVAVLSSAMDVLQPPAGLTSRGSVGGSTGGAVGSVALLAAASPTTLQRMMQRSAAAEMTALEGRLTFLATTASVAPFIGLFGTVWGVLTSFMGLSNTDTATLKAVGPGIAEALIATAFGLFAAIPAVIFYNQFVNKIRNIASQLDDLQAEMLAIAEGNGR
jgi:biopolymer transport protein TolQ